METHTAADTLTTALRNSERALATSKPAFTGVIGLAAGPACGVFRFFHEFHQGTQLFLYIAPVEVTLVPDHHAFRIANIQWTRREQL
jgi:hypothetical protein